MVEPGAPLVYRATGRGRALATTAAPVLVLVGLAIVVAGGPGGLVLVALGALPVTTLRQRAVLSERDLTVQGRFTRRQVDLVDLRAAHEDRTHVVWIDAQGQRPFRVYFARPTESTVDRDTALVPAIRRRAAACGAPVDVHAELIARPPRGTSPFFTL